MGLGKVSTSHWHVVVELEDMIISVRGGSLAGQPSF